MKIVIQVKLLPSESQKTALEDTMKAFNDACNHIAEVAYRERCASKFKLQKLVYNDVRELFGLSAQLTIRAIAKVVDAYKRDLDVQCFFRPTGAVVYDQRVMSFKGLEFVSLLTLQGRLVIPLQMGNYQRAQFHRGKGQADLILVKGQFYLLVVVDTPTEPPYEPEGFIGVDLGIVCIATDSDGEVHSGEAIEKTRSRYHKLRQALQKKGTKSAKRHLKKIRRKEQQFRKNTNHRIANGLVGKAKDTHRGVALEELKGIRGRTTVRKFDRAKHSGWAFYQLQQFILYKAELAGVPVVMIDSRNTSRQCYQCGHIAKSNRKSQAEFRCGSCGHAENADLNAARNIAQKGRVSCGLS